MKNRPIGLPRAVGRLGPEPVAESPRRGRDVSLPRPALEIYGWEIGGKPVSIKFPIDVVERLEGDIAYGLRMSTPCDITGLLIGRFVTETELAIVVDGYELAGYTANSGDPTFSNDERLADMVKHWSQNKERRRPVGFFRSQRRPTPALDPEDVKGAQRLLPRTQNIFLLIRTAPDSSATAMLFLRQANSSKVEEEYGEFTFDADLLRKRSEATPKREVSPLPFVSASQRNETVEPVNGKTPPAGTVATPKLRKKLAQSLANEMRRAHTKWIAYQAVWAQVSKRALPIVRRSRRLPRTVTAAMLNAGTQLVQRLARGRRSARAKWTAQQVIWAQVFHRAQPIVQRSRRMPRTVTAAMLNAGTQLVQSLARGRRLARAKWTAQQVILAQVFHRAQPIVQRSRRMPRAATAAVLNAGTQLVESLASGTRSARRSWTACEAVLVRESKGVSRASAAALGKVWRARARWIAYLAVRAERSRPPQPTVLVEPSQPVTQPFTKIGDRRKPVELFVAPKLASAPSAAAAKPSAQAKSPGPKPKDISRDEVATWFAKTPPPPPPPARHSWLSIAATWTIAVGATMLCLDGRSLLNHKRVDVTETSPVIVSNPLGLQVERNGGLLEIAWDRASATAINSQGGFMTIRDGGQLKQLYLDPAEIRTGHLYYGPKTSDVGIRLEVRAEDGENESESIRVLGAPAQMAQAR